MSCDRCNLVGSSSYDGPSWFHVLIPRPESRRWEREFRYGNNQANAQIVEKNRSHNESTMESELPDPWLKELAG